ncbi:ATP-binding protein [Thiocystis violacea]|uniref:sensor histidine kinase n=1 Tax=Thiocystis violacea TaxID=13725 RepID=UPI0019084E2D|nr:ATP-binding protein [Thiocystis violacea]MBK1716956.1 hypothetical protein [Thiocystis violacea]
MRWITMLYGATATIASTLAGIYLAAWVMQRDNGAYLMFVLLAASIVGVVGTEFWMLHTRTLEEYGLAMRWWHVPTWSGICAIVGLVHLRLRPRFLWVGWLAVALRTVALVANFTSGSSLNYAALTGIDQIRLLGEPLSMATGVPNPWMLAGQVSNVLLLLFILDGGLSAWRRRERQRALSLVLSLLIPVALGTIQVVLVFWGFVQMPVFIAPLMLFIAIAMGYELSIGLLRAVRAEREVQSMDAALGVSAQRLSLAAEASGAGFWSLEGPSEDVWATERTRELFGLPRTGSLNLADFLERVHRRDRTRLKALIEVALRSNDSYRTEFRVLDPDGGVRWLAGLGRCVAETASDPRTLMGVSMDITARRAMQDKIRRQRARLERASRVEALAEFSASMAHELSQPLTMILTNAEAAQALMAQPVPNLSEVREILADIVSADRRAADVIRHARSILERGEPEPEPEPEHLSVNDEIKRVLTLIGSELDDQGVNLSLSLASSLPSVQANGLMIEQVVVNLLNNACEAVAGNRPHERRISVVTLAHADKILVEVADNGCGAPDPKRIFDAFYTTKPKGLGMGLAIVRSIVRGHGGRIWAESAPGRGTTIYLSLPRDGPTS